MLQDGRLSPIRPCSSAAHHSIHGRFGWEVFCPCALERSVETSHWFLLHSESANRKKAIKILGSLTFQWKRVVELRLTWLYCFLLNEYLVYCNLFIKLSIIPHKIWYEFMWKVITIFTFHYSPVFMPIQPSCRNNTVWHQCQRTSNVVGWGSHGHGHLRGTRASGSGGRRGHEATSHVYT